MSSQEEIVILLQDINERLKKIEEKVDNLKSSTRKMDEHIDFIDNIYDRVKKPFSQLLGFSKPIDKNLICCPEEK
jgi:archaellum component FlaC